MRIPRTFTSKPRPIATALILVNVVCFVLEQAFQPTSIALFALWPWHSEPRFGGAPFQPWQLLTYSFLHSPLAPDQPWRIAHLVLNMVGLYVFGSKVERVLKPQRFLCYYLVCVVGAALAQLAVMGLSHQRVGYVVGASGGVFGILLAYGVSFPRREISLFPLPFTIKARWIALLYGVVEFLTGMLGTGQGVAHFAHLGGMAAGNVLMLYWRRPRKRVR